MKRILIAALVATLCLGGAAFASEKSHGGGNGHGKAHWGYSGEAGPEHWGDLSEKFGACSEGRSQSPVNLTGMVKGALGGIQFSYKDSSLKVVNNGHTVKADYAEGSQIKIDGQTYKLLQFHFHTPSENQIEGRSYPMEAHLVHADAKGNLAVVAVMFEEGKANPLVEKVWRYMPAVANSDKIASGTVINVMEMLPADKDYYAFEGSLTTPPCTEGVRWMVLKNAVEASAKQIGKFEMTMHHPNNRPVQPLYGRTVYK